MSRYPWVTTRDVRGGVVVPAEDAESEVERLRAEVEQLTREVASLRHDADREWGASATARANLQSALECATDTVLGLHLELERATRLHTEERTVLRETLEQFGRERDEARAEVERLRRRSTK